MARDFTLEYGSPTTLTARDILRSSTGTQRVMFPIQFVRTLDFQGTVCCHEAMQSNPAAALPGDHWEQRETTCQSCLRPVAIAAYFNSLKRPSEAIGRNGKVFVSAGLYGGASMFARRTAEPRSCAQTAPLPPQQESKCAVKPMGLLITTPASLLSAVAMSE